MRANREDEEGGKEGGKERERGREREREREKKKADLLAHEIQVLRNLYYFKARYQSVHM